MTTQSRTLLSIDAYDILHDNLLNLQRVSEKLQEYAVRQGSDEQIVRSFYEEIDRASTNLKELEKLLNNRLEDQRPETQVGKELIDIIKVLGSVGMSEDRIHTVLCGYFNK